MGTTPPPPPTTTTTTTTGPNSSPLGMLAAVASPIPDGAGQPAGGHERANITPSPPLAPGSPSTQAAMRRTRHRPGSAIPATQLDVLALVTATSPPMPSRREWGAHSTPKPAFARDQRTPPPPPPQPQPPRNGHGNGGSDSDTVSEDELTLRSYSSRRRARHHSVRMRALPEMHAGPLSVRTGRRLPGADGAAPKLHQAASAHAPRARAPRAAAAAAARDDGDTTETDDEGPSHAHTPLQHRRAAVPASEPALDRRQRLRRVPGTVLSRRLSELAEEADDPRLPQPPGPPGPPRIAGQPSGSSTETDSELAAWIPGSSTETEPEHPGAAGRPANGVRLGQPRAPGTRPHYQMPPLGPAAAAAGNGHQQRPAAWGDARDSDSGGETTETDDDFFGQARAVHSSIRPPRRVVRRLEGLRARHSHHHPAPLHLARPPRTAPAAGLDAAPPGERATGLGISSDLGFRPSALRTGSGRVLSTPSLVAAAAAATAAMEAEAKTPGAAEAAAPARGDPFAPPADEVTFRGAALRRLERAHGRPPAAAAAATTAAAAAAASRKRALTAPSSLEPPLGRRAAYGPGGRLLATAESLLEDPVAETTTTTASGYNTPPEHHARHLGRFLGESPVSSLRSSLLARAPHAEPASAAAAARTPLPADATTTAPSTPCSAAPATTGGPADGSASPSMSAALRQSRKRRRSSSPPPSQPPAPAAALFPPIDRPTS
ncbi:hypothetical protein H4R18_005664 [Coemansia javaensis]|uniref:Uncharacterized protein n=1 Tax=Coemansia javaensis TaxID=2761396 RepID=A0A9W8LF79_9FUNG|nr:hypothetical protein H4R18_005664 [Coemansia javaensis]